MRNVEEQKAIKEWKGRLASISTCLNNEDYSHHYECIDALVELLYIMRLFYTGQTRFYKPKKK